MAIYYDPQSTNAKIFLKGGTNYSFSIDNYNNKLPFLPQLRIKDFRFEILWHRYKKIRGLFNKIGEFVMGRNYDIRYFIDALYKCIFVNDQSIGDLILHFVQSKDVTIRVSEYLRQYKYLFTEFKLSNNILQILMQRYKIEWNTMNYMEQFTGSFNPIHVHPIHIFGKYYKHHCYNFDAPYDVAFSFYE